MGARGPKPKPSALKKKQGTFQKSRAPENEFEPEPIKVLPKPPLFLNKYSKNIYFEIGPILLEQGLLTNVDMDTFISYCIEMGTYYECKVALKKEGQVIKSKSGYMQPHPLVAICNASFNNAQKIAANFGFSPSARTRVGVAKQPEKKLSKLLSLIPKKGQSNG